MDLHDRFSDWLADDADGEPPRDLALHASTCDECMRAVAVVESLQAIDVGAAALPPAHALGSGRRPFAVARIAIGALAVILLVVSVAIGASGLFRATPAASDEPSATPTGRVLAGAPSPDATDSPTPSPSPSRSPTPSPSASESVASDPTAAPAQPQPQPPARTAAPQPPPPTVAPPTAEPTVQPPPPPPPTQSPSPSIVVPPSTPTPLPTPTDTDGDGVPDSVDLCPLEHAGSTPDPLRPGCPLPLP